MWGRKHLVKCYNCKNCNVRTRDQQMFSHAAFSENFLLNASSLPEADETITTIIMPRTHLLHICTLHSTVNLEAGALTYREIIFYDKNDTNYSALAFHRKQGTSLQFFSLVLQRSRNTAIAMKNCFQTIIMVTEEGKKDGFRWQVWGNKNCRV